MMPLYHAGIFHYTNINGALIIVEYRQHMNTFALQDI